MFAFDVSLCEFSTLGPMKKCSVQSPSPPLSLVWSAGQTAAFKKQHTKCWFNQNANLAKLGFWYLWMSLLDKNVLPLNPLVLHCFQREKMGGTIIQHLLLHLKMRENFCMVGRCAGRTLENIQSRYLVAY